MDRTGKPCKCFTPPYEGRSTLVSDIKFDETFTLWGEEGGCHPESLKTKQKRYKPRHPLVDWNPEPVPDCPCTLELQRPSPMLPFFSWLTIWNQLCLTWPTVLLYGFSECLSYKDWDQVSLNVRFVRGSLFWVLGNFCLKENPQSYVKIPLLDWTLLLENPLEQDLRKVMVQRDRNVTYSL